MRGAIKEAQKIGFEINDHFHFESPNLIWPEDRSWIFVEELDFNATLIGGSQELIQKVSLMNELNSRIFHRTETAVDLGINNW